MAVAFGAGLCRTITRKQQARPALSSWRTANGADRQIYPLATGMVLHAGPVCPVRHTPPARLPIPSPLCIINDIAWNTEFNGIKVLSAATQRVTLQTGANAGQTLVVSTSGAASTALGVGTLNISTMATATAALSTLDLAIRSVTSIRATLGAQQNRLEFTINTLAIQEENAAAAESAIRDADIARETIEFTRTQILVSAGTSVLAQANLVPQTALSLLG